MKKNKIIFLKPIIWILTQILGLIPGFGKSIKAIEGDKEIRRLEKLGRYNEARRLREHLFDNQPVL